MTLINVNRMNLNNSYTSRYKTPVTDQRVTPGGAHQDPRKISKKIGFEKRPLKNCKKSSLKK